MSIASWLTLSAHNPANLSELQSPTAYSCPARGESREEWVFLVYMISNPNSQKSQFVLNQKYENLIFTRDVLSTSLISNSHRRTITNTIGYILDVPPQNIISTNPHDIGFPNEIGLPTDVLSESYGEEIAQLRGSYKLVEYINRHVNRTILPPKTLLSLTPKNEHNEVLIVTKPDVHIYQNLPATGSVKIKGVIMIHRPIYREGTPMGDIESEERERMIRLTENTARINGVKPIYA